MPFSSTRCYGLHDFGWQRFKYNVLCLIHSEASDSNWMIFITTTFSIIDYGKSRRGSYHMTFLTIGTINILSHGRLNGWTWKNNKNKRKTLFHLIFIYSHLFLIYFNISLCTYSRTMSKVYIAKNLIYSFINLTSTQLSSVCLLIDCIFIIYFLTIYLILVLSFFLSFIFKWLLIGSKQKSTWV